MKVPLKFNTTWHYSLDSEAERIVGLAVCVYNLFFLKYGFRVLPSYKKTDDPSYVYFPDLDYQKIPGFINKVARIYPLDIPLGAEDHLIQTIKRKLQQRRTRVDRKEVQKLKSDWVSKEKPFWEFARLIFPGLLNRAVELEIYTTEFGPNVSFGLPKKSKKRLTIKLYLRQDQKIAFIAEGVLSSLIKQQLKKTNKEWEENWTENETVVDFLLKTGPLKKLFPDYRPTLTNLRRKNEAFLESQNYLKKIGVSIGETFSINENQVRINNKQPVIHLTKNETKLLKLLVLKKNRLCTHEEIGNIIWQNSAYDSFSPWAITKLVQRLRKKLEAEGLSPALIQACRGQGYLLKD